VKCGRPKQPEQIDLCLAKMPSRGKMSLASELGGGLGCRHLPGSVVRWPSAQSKHDVQPRTSEAAPLGLDAEALHFLDHFFVEVLPRGPSHLNDCPLVRKLCPATDTTWLTFGESANAAQELRETAILPNSVAATAGRLGSFPPGSNQREMAIGVPCRQAGYGSRDVFVAGGPGGRPHRIRIALRRTSC
jgi:hypothetical protein